MTENSETPIEPGPEDAIYASLEKRFASPVYFWDLSQKRAFLLLAALAKWNPSLGAIYQFQLIHLTGLDLDPFRSRTPDALRALTIAISRKHSIKLKALGNGQNRNYRFKTAALRESVVRYMSLERSEKIFLFLRKETDQARAREAF